MASVTTASAATSIASAEAQYAQQPLPLGVSLPVGDTHALSVSIPTWEEVVGYEEARPEVINAMACGYPRFLRHPLVRKLESHLKQTLVAFQEKLTEGEWDLMALPTEQTAVRLQSFLSTQTDAALTATATQRVAVHNVEDGLVYAVVFEASLMQTAKRFWQHTGEIISSRHAERILELLTATSSATSTSPPPQRPQLRDTPAHKVVRARVAALYFGADHAAETSCNVFVYPTGMAAIFAALRLLTHFNKDSKAILFGFPYLDTPKLLQRPQWCPAGVHFFPKASEQDLQRVKELLTTEKILAVFTEFPSNPLLSVPDLERLASLAHANGTFLAVDDTVGSYNVNALQHGAADLVLTSLSKIFSGTCNVMAGSLVLNPRGAGYHTFLDHLTATNDSFLVDSDAQLLCATSADLDQRLARVNASTSLIVERLQHHALVKELYYPQLSTDVACFHRFQTQTDSAVRPPQYGPLFSVVLHGGEPVARAFYDRMRIAKGPSLGTNFSLACPYTVIAHYDELDFVESCGVDRHLVRISIGLEDPETLWATLQDALAHAQSVFQHQHA